jgi:hypothetical protein
MGHTQLQYFKKGMYFGPNETLFMRKQWALRHGDIQFYTKIIGVQVPIILATQEAEIRTTKGQSQSLANSLGILISKTAIRKKDCRSGSSSKSIWLASVMCWGQTPVPQTNNKQNKTKIKTYIAKVDSQDFDHTNEESQRISSWCWSRNME